MGFWLVGKEEEGFFLEMSSFSKYLNSKLNCKESDMIKVVF